MFTVTDETSAPIPCNLFGTVYHLPRFTFPDFGAWGEARAEEEFAAYMEEIEDAEQRALFRRNYPPRQPALVELLDELVTKPGAEYVLRHCMKAAGVPDDVIKKSLAKGDPVLLIGLAQKLSHADRAKAAIENATKTDDERKAEEDGDVDPKSDSASSSADSPGTGGKNADGSSSPTAPTSNAA